MALPLINRQLRRSRAGRFEMITDCIHDVGPEEVVVRPIVVGLCGTDKQMLRQERNDSARVIGHEGVGGIVLVGTRVRQFHGGERVVFNPVNPCNQESILGHSTEGLLQDYRVISQDELAWGLIVPLAGSCPAELAGLAEPLGAAIYANDLVDQISSVHRLAIVGAGPEGLLNVLYASEILHRDVFLVHNESSRLTWAAARLHLRPDRMFLDSEHLPADILRVTEGAGVDATILCTSRRGALTALSRAAHYTRARGCIDLTVGFGSHDRLAELPELDLNDIRRRNVCGCPAKGDAMPCRISGQTLYLTGHRGTGRGHILRALEILSAHSSSYERLISHRIPFEAASELLMHIATSHLVGYKQEQLVKALITFSTESYDRTEIRPL